MTDAEIEGGTLYANLSERTVRGLLMPYGEVSRNSNIGKIAFPKGTLKLPRDPAIVGANIQHDRENPVGRATSLDDTDAGVVATFAIANTDEGDQLLLDIESGKLARLSAEVKGIFREADGVTAKAGVLFGAAFVTEGAFASAALYAELAPEPITETPAAATAEVTPIPETPKEKESPTVTAEIIPDAATTVTPEALALTGASATFSYTPPKRTSEQAKREVLSALVRRSKGISTPADDSLYASMVVKAPGAQALYAAVESSPALDIIPFSGGSNPAPYGPSSAIQYLGELTETAYGFTSFLQLVGREDLTAPTVQGFHFGTLPTAGSGASSWASSWAGNGTAVPTSLITTTTSTATAKYFAGGIETPIEWELFGLSEALLSKYFSRQAANFGLFMDAGIWSAISTAVTFVDATNPSGVGIGADWSQVYDAIANVQTNGGGQADAVVAAPDVYNRLMKVQVTNGAAVLRQSGSITGSGDLDGVPVYKDLTGQIAAGHVLAGNFKQGVTAFTLPDAPLRFQARNITAGGALDTAVVGAGAVLLENAQCFSYVSTYGASS